MTKTKSKPTTKLPTPWGSRVLVRLVEIEEQTGGGIFVPKRAQVQRLRGTVLSAGEEAFPEGYEGPRLTDLIGKEVIFLDMGIPEIEDLEGYLIVPEDAIVAVFE